MLLGHSVLADYELSRDGVKELHGANEALDYSTDLFVNETIGFLAGHKALNTTDPFFVYLAVVAPHAGGPNLPEVGKVSRAPVLCIACAAAKYASLYPDLKMPVQEAVFNKHIDNLHWFTDVEGLTGPLDDVHLNVSQWNFRSVSSCSPSQRVLLPCLARARCLSGIASCRCCRPTKGWAGLSHR